MKKIAQAFLFWYFPFFILFRCMSAGQSDPGDLDTRFFRSINNARSPFFGSIVDVVDYTVEPIGYSLPVIFMGAGAAMDDEELFDTGFLLGAAELSSIVVIQSLKRIVARDRPYVQLENVTTDHLSSSDAYSFPSGHTGTAFVAATMLTLRYPKPGIIIPALAWAAIVGYGRIYLGLHYPGDVLSGMIIGAGCSTLAYVFRDDLIKLRRWLLGDSLFFGVRVFPDGGGVQMVYRF